MTPEERLDALMDFAGEWCPIISIKHEIIAAIREAEAETECKYQTLIEELRAELEEARANARHYIGLALKFESHKERQL